MHRVISGKTSLFIAHRLSTISDAKEILVLGEGAVAERGSHAELITRPHSFYAEMWAKQNAALDEARHSRSQAVDGTNESG